MTIVILSKNGEPFVDNSMQYLRETTTDANIIIMDNGYKNLEFITNIATKYDADLISFTDTGMFAWIDKLSNITDERIFILHDNFYVKDKKFYQHMIDKNSDMTFAISFENHLVGADTTIIKEMLEFLPKELWVCHGGPIMGYYSLEFLNAIRNDSLLRKYCSQPLYPYAYVLERLLPSYMHLNYNYSMSWLYEYNDITRKYYMAIPYGETDTFVKIEGSFLLGRNREKINTDLSISLNTLGSNNGN